MPPPASCLSARLSRVRTALDEAGVGVLIVTHLPNVRFLTAFPGSAAILVVGSEECQFITDSRYTVAAAAHLDENVGRPGMCLIKVDRSYDETLAEVVARLGPIRVGFEAAHLSFRRYERLKAALVTASVGHSGAAAPTLVPTDRIVERIRAVKDSYEVDTLRAAAGCLSDVARSVLREVGPGRTERDTASMIDGRLRDAGFERPAFETIVASGPNSVLPHARPTTRLLEEGDLVVLDFGGIYDGYCVDLTRTVSLGEPRADWRQLHAAVAEAQDAAISAVRPGRWAGEVDDAARSALTARGFGEAFLHGTGHGLGLEVHEEPRVGRRDRAPNEAVASGSDGPLQAGMVFTVEPGAYQPGVGGVRIEDDVLVTEEGCDVLTDVTRELWIRESAGAAGLGR